MRKWVPILCLFFTASVLGQQTELPQHYFKKPLDIPLILAGTFGELRSGHFHSGMDIKTQQRTGLPVSATASGYVKRIKIQRYGYGKALYIQHPNGYTSVYGHLSKFAPKIQKYLKRHQYEKEEYELQLFPESDELKVEQGDQIAFSGNSGGSGGPHLHFEIRDSQSRPMNPLQFGFDIKDTKKPIVQSFYAYPLGDVSHIDGITKRQRLRLIPLQNGEFKTEPFKAYGKIGFGISSIDKFNFASNSNGLYEVETVLNGQSYFKVRFDKFSFAETRYIKRYIDYPYYAHHDHRIQQLFRQKNNALSMITKSEKEGILDIKENFDYSYEVIARDYKGNETVIHVPVEVEKLADSVMQHATRKKTPYFASADHASVFEVQNCDVYIPKRALYEDTYLDIKAGENQIKVGDKSIPLHKNMTIGFNTSDYKKEDKSKLYIARISDWGTPIYSSTYKKENRITTRTDDFGTYRLETDKTQPEIRPVNVYDGKWMTKYDQLKINIDDDDSGVRSFRATINGKFILMEYDYKTHRLVYNFADAVNTTETENKLKLIVVDKVGNTAKFETTFYRKN